MATFGNNFTGPHKIILSLFLSHQANIIIANLVTNNIKQTQNRSLICIYIYSLKSTYI